MPPLFADFASERSLVSGDGTQLKDGGAAMTAYARMKFSDIPDQELGALGKALLKYYELDMLAMVMIY